MIITRIIGGLGNQLFQYAIGKSLAIKHNAELVLDVSYFEHYKLHAYSLHHFNIPQTFYKSPSRFKKKVNLVLYNNRNHPFESYLEKSLTFDPTVLKVTDNTYLSGYWGSEKYFSSIKNELLSDLELQTPLSVYSKEILNKINNSNAVAVHVRRGDYVTNSVNQKIYFACDKPYYEAAYQQIIKNIDNPTFYIFSNDIAWAKENLTFIKPSIYIENPLQKNYEDFHLMRSCKHIITANSTYSWWAAWSNKNSNKLVITPGKWFLVERHPDGMLLDTKDLIPDSWIKI